MKEMTDMEVEIYNRIRESLTDFIDRVRFDEELAFRSNVIKSWWDKVYLNGHDS